MPRPLSQHDAELFWRQQHSALITRDDTLPDHRQHEQQQQQRQHDQDQQEAFRAMNGSDDTAPHTVHVIQVAENLSFWASNSSWSYCETCYELVTEKLKPHFDKRPRTQHVNSCKCTSE